MRFKRHRKKTDSLLAEKKPFFSPHRKVQTKEDQVIKKKIRNASTDKSEKQADEYADNVVKGSEMNNTTGQPAFAKASEDEETSAGKTQAQKQEEEETATKSEIQKQEEDETAAKLEIQKQEEDETAAKLEIQKQEEGETAAKNETPPFESRVKAAKTGGVPLTDKVRKEMEMKLKSKFGEVRIHTDDMAIELCREIHAQAFTNGYHIFFNKGKFNPDSYSGKHLLAHELTHVIQQKGK